MLIKEQMLYMISKNIDIEYVKSILDYNPNTGVLTWKRRPLFHFKSSRSCSTWNSRYAGKSAGYVHSGSSLHYKSVVVGIDNNQYKAHRIAWAIYYSEQPPEQIDHENHIATDNRISNLKKSSYKDNRKNVSKQSNNSSGTTGVYFRKDTLKWCAYGNSNNRRKILGSFETEIEAIEKRREWESENGFHKNHGK